MWKFDMYGQNHMDQHQIRIFLTLHTYTGIDEQSKVHHFIASVKTDKFDSAKL